MVYVILFIVFFFSVILPIGLIFLMIYSIYRARQLKKRQDTQHRVNEKLEKLLDEKTVTKDDLKKILQDK